MKTRLIAALAAAFLLAGCVQTGATLLAEGTYLLNAGIDYVHRVHDKRRTVEELCWLSVMLTVQEIRSDEQKTEADVRRFLRDVYPRLVTLELIRQTKDGQTGILSTPPGCPDDGPATPPPQERPEEPPIGPPLLGVPLPEERA